MVSVGEGSLFSFKGPGDLEVSTLYEDDDFEAMNKLNEFHNHLRLLFLPYITLPSNQQLGYHNQPKPDLLDLPAPPKSQERHAKINQYSTHSRAFKFQQFHIPLPLKPRILPSLTIPRLTPSSPVIQPGIIWPSTIPSSTSFLIPAKTCCP